MVEKLDNILMFLDAVNDLNPIHRDTEKSYELAQLMQQRGLKINAKKEQILPGLYFASRMLCMNENSMDVAIAGFEFLSPVYIGDETFIADGRYLKVNNDNAIVANFRKKDDEEKKEDITIKTNEKSACIERTLEFNFIKGFAESLGLGIYASNDERRFLKAYAGSMISGALWKIAEGMKDQGFGLYRRQTWEFHNAPKYGKISAKADLMKNKGPVYFFSTVVEQEDMTIVSGHATCVFIGKQQ